MTEKIIASAWEPEDDDKKDNNVEPKIPDGQTNGDGRVYHPGDDLEAEHVNPEMDKGLWNSLVWSAIREALDKATVKEDVFRMVRLWNLQNNPQLPQKELDQKVIWALRKWDNKFRKN